MAIKVQMPKLSDTMQEGVIAKWLISEGDTVSSGDIIAEVETDKATMDVEVFDSGTVLKLVPGEGDSVPLGGTIAIIGEEGEDISALLEDNDSSSGASETKEKAEETKDSDDSKEEEKKVEEKTASSDSDDDRVKASPLARKIAKDKGINLSDVSGSGPNGRIVKKDVENFTPTAATESTTQAATFKTLESKEIKVSQMRKVIARRLSESKFTNPHFYETVDVDMKATITARKAMNEMNDVRISFNDIVVKACAVALSRHPEINSSWNEDYIIQHGEVNVAVAVAIDEGLMTPVIRHADQKGLLQISSDTRELAGLARDRKLQPDQMEGSTFTVSNLGMFGIEQFTAIINPPNACILAVGAIRDVPVVENGQVVPGKRMKLTLSSDHRVVDGAKAAIFLSEVKTLLENPISMLL